MSVLQQRARGNRPYFSGARPRRVVVGSNPGAPRMAAPGAPWVVGGCLVVLRAGASGPCGGRALGAGPLRGPGPAVAPPLPWSVAPTNPIARHYHTGAFLHTGSYLPGRAGVFRSAGAAGRVSGRAGLWLVAPSALSGPPAQ